MQTLEGDRHHLKGRIAQMEVSQIYVSIRKLHMKIMQEEHDVPMADIMVKKPQEWP